MRRGQVNARVRTLLNELLALEPRGAFIVPSEVEAEGTIVCQHRRSRRELMAMLGQAEEMVRRLVRDEGSGVLREGGPHPLDLC